MANTSQAVHWTLAQQCTMRIGPDWSNPKVANAQLSTIKVHSEFQGEVLDDIWITSHTLNGSIEIPNGYIVSKTFAEYGGLSLVESQCHVCPANTRLHPDFKGLAGCTGTFFYAAGSKELDDWINDLLEHQQLKDRFDIAFLQTNPRWFGLWTESPLNSEQCVLLDILFRELAKEEKDPSDQRDIQSFLSALGISINRKIPLNVTMSPPGHAGLGLRLTYSHCPRCKAYARPLEGEQQCEVCNYSFVA